MRRVLPVLALIAFACDVSRVGPLVHGDPVRKPEAAGRSGDHEYQTKPRGQHDNDGEVLQSPAEDREERSSEPPPVGKWRSNGEALEPKWRDGDSVPLLPFSQYRSYARDDEVEDAAEQAAAPETSSRRPFKYALDQPDRPRGNPPPARRFQSRDDYRGRDYEEPEDEDYPRRRRRPLKSPQSPTFYEETIDGAESSDVKRGRNIIIDGPSSSSSLSLNEREATWRYREAFQARPNEYEQEFSDEEYLRPRPRKRRPPQNYEFALANEATPDNDGDGEPRDASSRRSPKRGDDVSPPAESSSSSSSTDRERENALELKSLLKMQQEEGSSLSEILQRRNLTLNDLLRGKADVINALKSKIEAEDESDEYIEEMSRVMSDSLMKLAATVTPPWGFARSSSTMTSTTTALNTVQGGTTSSVSQTTTAAMKNETTTRSPEEKPANDTNRAFKEEDLKEDVEKPTQSHDSPWLRAPTTPLTLSTVITTSPSPPPVVVNSAEYFLNDDGNVESSASDRATRLENLDEDEIMEFSDFTDFKKGKGPAAAWTSERIVSQQAPRDTESTLSIEQILKPTERTKLKARGRENHDRVTDDASGNSDGKAIQQIDGQSVPIVVKDHSTFVETEYQGDTTKLENGRRSKTKSHSSLNPDPAAASGQTENPTDDRDQLGDKNHSAEYHQVTRPTSDASPRYEDVISEIEPEARAEIFELFASGSAGKRLERLLKSRNMSVEELIALRQRGSSKVHLTEVSRLKMSQPKNHQTTETFNANNGEIIIPLLPVGSSSDERGFGGDETISEREEAKQEADETMNRFKDIMSYLHDPFFDRNAENMSRLLDQALERERNTARGTTYSENDTLNDEERTDELENSRRTVQIVDLLTTFGSLPFARDVQRQFEAEVENEREPKTRLPMDNDNASVVVIDEKAEKSSRSGNSSKFHAGYVEEVVREEPSDTVDVRTTVYGETAVSSTRDGGEEKKTLSRVKPSIIASGAILGVTIVVFLAIFIVCRIRQKQKYMYRNTFSRAVFQGPVMAARKLSNSSSLSAVMVNVVATSTTKRPTERTQETQEAVEDFDGRSDMDNDSLDANDSWETIPDYAK
ncbi:uncharacterized protein LOC105830513 isoform X1 [Monomorium pharaonis]|uniref:uncharacterized protein LOC105830513 isoform X1 n=1 Tax=Monomorium pharaonis TaxID=307658 RepID=UPI0017460218|nr:uncharacterized protein LOC105830513 isoform X1 [Monomorium pharaonis]